MTKIPTSYLSVRTNQQHQRVWTVIHRSLPLCADNTNLQEVLSLAQLQVGKLSLQVWDGDVGQFTSEMVADIKAVSCCSELKNFKTRLGD